jgi:hypothetical protein
MKESTNEIEMGVHSDREIRSGNVLMVVFVVYDDLMI